MFGPLLDVQMSFRLAGARDSAPCQKWAKRVGFVAVSKVLTGVGHVQRIWQDAFSAAGAVPTDMFIRDVRKSGSWFPERGCILEHPRSFCVTGAALCMTWHHFFVAGAILQRHGLEKSQNALVRGRQVCIQLPLLKEVSQDCFIFDVANCKNWGSLAELLRFCFCQPQKLRKSRRIASLSSLQIADRQIDRLDRKDRKD